MKLQILFSGPCAYVPNRIVTDPQPAAPSWSAIFPDVTRGLSVGGAELMPHYTVLQFFTDLFHFDDEIVDLRFRKKGGREFALVLLSGHQIRIETGESTPFRPVLEPLDEQTLATGRPATQQQRDSLAWLPFLEDLFPGAGVLGNDDNDYFDGAFPVEGNLGAHVLLEQGELVTHSLTPDLAPPNQQPSIWDFRVPPEGPVLRRQAVAHTVALRIDPLTPPLSIRLTKGGTSRLISLREGVEESPLTIEIKNREMDEILRIAQGQIAEGTLDIDFKALYMFSGKHMAPCPLPVLFRAGGLGCLRTTCGGGGFVAFSESLADTLARFPATHGGGVP